MAQRDADGLVRVDVEWSIEGAKGTRSGKLYDLCEQEVRCAKQGLKEQARVGDTVTIREI